MRFLLLASALTATVSVQAQGVLPKTAQLTDEIQLGRYTTQQGIPTPEIALPLRAVVRITYPRSLVSTVGDALRHTLMRTGYRLDEALPAQAQEFLRLSLPESQRVIGPYTVETVLQTLLGPAWRLKQDPVTRSVSFERSTD